MSPPAEVHLGWGSRKHKDQRIMLFSGAWRIISRIKGLHVSGFVSLDNAVSFDTVFDQDSAIVLSSSYDVH